MYHHVSGKLARKSPGAAVVEAGGVGYQIRISLATFERLPEPGAEVRLLTRLMVREDAHELVGFREEAERQVFDALLAVNGVGTNLALAVLSTMAPAELAEAVRTGNVAALRRVKGLGEKKAERLVLELRGRVEELMLGPRGAAAGRPPAGASEDAAGALVALGYRRPEAEAAVRRALAELGPAAAVQELIRQALRHAK